MFFCKTKISFNECSDKNTQVKALKTYVQSRNSITWGWFKYEVQVLLVFWVNVHPLGRSTIENLSLKLFVYSLIPNISLSQLLICTQFYYVVQTNLIYILLFELNHILVIINI